MISKGPPVLVIVGKPLRFSNTWSIFANFPSGSSPWLYPCHPAGFSIGIFHHCSPSTSCCMFFQHFPSIFAAYYPGWWFGTSILFSHSVGFLIIPIDELIFFRGVAKNHQPGTDFFLSECSEYIRIYPNINCQFFNFLIIPIDYIIFFRGVAQPPTSEP